MIQDAQVNFVLLSPGLLLHAGQDRALQINLQAGRGQLGERLLKWPPGKM